MDIREPVAKMRAQAEQNHRKGAELLADAQQFMAEFKTDTLVPSSAHGSATPPNFASGVNDEMGQFLQNKDVTKTASNLQKLSDEFLKTA